MLVFFNFMCYGKNITNQEVLLMNIPKVNISFRKLKVDVISSSEEDGLFTFHYMICPDASAEDSFPERFQLSSSSLP